MWSLRSPCTAEIDIAVCSLLRLVEGYASHLEVIDEGGYWQSGDPETLVARMEQLNAALTMFALAHMSGRPVMFCDIQYLNRAEGWARFLNCGTAATRLAGGKQNVTVDIVVRIANALEISPETLLASKDEIVQVTREDNMKNTSLDEHKTMFFPTPDRFSHRNGWVSPGILMSLREMRLENLLSG